MFRSLVPKLTAEFIGTFWLVLGGCGSAVLAAAFPEVGIGLAGVSLAFGLTVLTGAYALGPISGGHFNPAVSSDCGPAAVSRVRSCCRMWWRRSSVAIVGAAVLYVIASGEPVSASPTASRRTATRSIRRADTRSRRAR